jgi:hypothetical protein
MMPLYALVDRQRQRAVKDGPRRASCAECGEPMRAKTGTVLIWHWAHVKDNPNCEAARESEWHLAWKALGIDGTQEITVGRHRADILAPGGYAVEFQASALDREKLLAREDDWAAQGGMTRVFRADKEFAARRIKTARSLVGYEEDLAEPERHPTLDITWSHAPDRVRAARAPSFLDIGHGELLFIGGWRPGSSPLTGYGWRVPKDAVVRNLLHGKTIPAPIAADPAELIRKIEERQRQEAAQKAKRRREEQRREAARQFDQWQRREDERQREDEQRQREQQRRAEIPARMATLAKQQAPSQRDPPPMPERPITQKLRQWRHRREEKRARKRKTRPEDA